MTSSHPKLMIKPAWNMQLIYCRRGEVKKYASWIDGHRVLNNHKLKPRGKFSSNKQKKILQFSCRMQSANCNSKTAHSHSTHLFWFCLTSSQSHLKYKVKFIRRELNPVQLAPTQTEWRKFDVVVKENLNICNLKSRASHINCET